MALETYKFIHLLGVLMIFLSIGGAIMHVINGGNKIHSWKKPMAITHGIGLLLALLGGFGALAKLGGPSMFPGWAIGKLLIWVFMAVVITILFKKKEWSKPLWLVMLLLGGFAAYLANFKPF